MARWLHESLVEMDADEPDVAAPEIAAADEPDVEPDVQRDEPGSAADPALTRGQQPPFKAPPRPPPPALHAKAPPALMSQPAGHNPPPAKG